MSLTESGIEGVPDLSPILYERSGDRGLSLHSHLDPPLSPEHVRRLARPHRTSHYFVLFVEKGTVRYSVDLQDVPATAGKVLFVRPHQVRVPPLTRLDAEYFKITFDESWFARLPRFYQFWLDPWEEHLITLPERTRKRLATLFHLLRETFKSVDDSGDLMISYLNTVMSELESVYLAEAHQRGTSRNVQSFLRFRAFVEENFMRQPMVSEAAQSLAMSVSALYSLVKELSGLSPKEYFNRRVAVEAERLVFYSGMSVKELAAHLGFEDESYFSRFFRKQTGRSISEFLSANGDLSRSSEDSSLIRRQPAL